MVLGRKTRIAASAAGLLLVAGLTSGCAEKTHAEDNAAVMAAANKATDAANAAQKAADRASEAAMRAEAAAAKAEAMFHKGLRK